MRTSTAVIVAGIALFLLPFPPTFTIGALVILAGVAYRFLAE
ncbi:hypothetical protein [Halogeometricum sp. CBA1124]|nr:hypothetical protein [Halogeometricum sp. CBA1124]